MMGTTGAELPSAAVLVPDSPAVLTLLRSVLSAPVPPDLTPPGLTGFVPVDDPPGPTDAVLWVAQAGVITRPQLARAAELIERNRIPVIGFVVNRMDSRSAGYGYEYYGRYYGEKSQYENA